MKMNPITCRQTENFSRSLGFILKWRRVIALLLFLIIAQTFSFMGLFMFYSPHNVPALHFHCWGKGITVFSGRVCCSLSNADMGVVWVLQFWKEDRGWVGRLLICWIRMNCTVVVFLSPCSPVLPKNSYEIRWVSWDSV